MPMEPGPFRFCATQGLVSMHRTRLFTVSAAITAALLAGSLALPTLVAAETGPASPIMRTTSALADTLAPVVLADAREAVATAKALEAEAAAASAAAASAAYRAPAKKSSKPAPKKSTKTANRPSSGSELAQATSILASLKAKYPRYLGGVTVSIGNASGYQAVAYYTSGRIVISPKHTASLSRILNHEIWHIIDWRDNGRIDWRESVPPAGASRFR
jgi:hypothetical protein